MNIYHFMNHFAGKLPFHWLNNSNFTKQQKRSARMFSFLLLLLQLLAGDPFFLYLRMMPERVTTMGPRMFPIRLGTATSPKAAR